MDQINFNQPSFYYRPKAKSKKVFWIGGLILILLIWGLKSLVFSSHSLTIERGRWWTRMGGIFSAVVAPQETAEEKLNQIFPLPLKETGRWDVLILGIRGKDDPEGGLLSDSILILSLEQKNKKLSLVSLPRDIFIEFPGIIAGKINEVYERGWQQNNTFSFSKNVFSRLSGVYIDQIIVFDFKAFAEIVNVLGGIEIELVQPFTEKNQWGHEFYLPAGKNQLDGDTALYYVRSRYSTSDFDRARRQQEIIMAIKAKAVSLDWLKSPWRLADLLNGLNQNISTDFNIFDTKKILDLFTALNSASALETKILSLDNILEQTIEDKIYLLRPKGGDWSLIRNFFVLN